MTAASRRKAPRRQRPARRGKISIKRVYDPRQPGDGLRILIDRLWPRGLSKDTLKLDRWVKELAPSNELRRWYGHDPERFDEFRRRYLAELEAPPAGEALEELRRRAEKGGVTLLTATRDVDHSGAAVLADAVQKG